MYRLRVVAGPNRGAVFPLSEGSNTVGRQTDNVIILPSAKVSKRHCALEVSNGGVTLVDQGSSNGTFVNGKLVRNRALHPGDKITVGEFVLEVFQPGVRTPVPSNYGNVIPFPGSDVQATSSAGQSFDQNQILSQIGSPGSEPSDIKEKAAFYFERFVMPIFYGWMTKTEWRFIALLMISGLIVANLVLGFTPVMRANHESIIFEAKKRATLIAREITEKNAQFIAQGAESKTEIGSIANDDGVKLAVLLDMKGAILAPSNQAGKQVLGEEGNVAVSAAKLFANGRERGVSKVLDDGLLVVVEPLKMVDTSTARNVVRAMAVVALDLNLSSRGIGTVGLLFSETFIISMLLMLAVLWILYRLTLKPFEVLNSDIDKALKGSAPHISNEFKWSEMDALFDVVHSAVQRIPKEGADGSGPAEISSEDMVRSLVPMTDTPGVGFVVFDENRKIAHMNAHFEDLSGIRVANAIGQEIAAVGRDESIIALVNDLMAQAANGFSATEETEFAGIQHRVTITAVPGKAAKAYMMAVVKKE